MKKSFDFNIVKTDPKQRIAFGYAYTSTVDGQPHKDSQEDIMGEDNMVKMSAQFMKNSRIALRSHSGNPIGEVLFMFPLTSEIAKQLEIKAKYTGPLIGMYIEDEDAWNEMTKSGNFGGFSIAGKVLESEII